MEAGESCPHFLVPLRLSSDDYVKQSAVTSHASGLLYMCHRWASTS